jgi:ribA/ribD-fused uncharacterized protein
MLIGILFFYQVAMAQCEFTLQELVTDQRRALPSFSIDAFAAGVDFKSTLLWDHLRAQTAVLRMKENDLRFAGFATAAKIGFRLNDVSFPTLNHFLYAMRFYDPMDLRRMSIFHRLVALPSEELDAVAEQNSSQARQHWESEEDSWLVRGTYEKFSQHPELKMALLSTGEDFLVFESKDSWWGNGLDDHGANRLGKVLMQIRRRFFQEQVPLLNFDGLYALRLQALLQKHRVYLKTVVTDRGSRVEGRLLFAAADGSSLTETELGHYRSYLPLLPHHLDRPWSWSMTPLKSQNQVGRGLEITILAPSFPSLLRSPRGPADK